MQIRSVQQKTARKGFTLLELLLVMAILVIMASMVTMAFVNIRSNANADLALSQISTLENACTSYKLQVGQYPSKLEDLYTMPSGMTKRKWRGPHLAKPVPLDPWSNTYKYSVDTTNNRVMIVSLGEDGQQGTEDDVPEPGQQ